MFGFFGGGAKPTAAGPGGTDAQRIASFLNAGSGRSGVPLTDEAAAIAIQRSFRGMIARKRLKEKSSTSALTGFASALATGVGSMVGGIVDNILLAPVNMASDALIHVALGRLLSTLVVGYDKRQTLKMTSSGIVIGGKAGLYLNDEALAALMGGMSPYANVWISSITIKLPALLTIYPVEVTVGTVKLAMPPVATVLTPQRMAQLDAAMHGTTPKPAPKPAAKKTSVSSADLDAHVIAAKYGERVADEDKPEGDGYGTFDRAGDAAVVRIELVELALPKFGAIMPTDPTAVDGRAAAAGAGGGRNDALRLADARLVSVGCLVCGVRRPTGDGPIARLLRRQQRGVSMQTQVPVGEGALIRLDKLVLGNATATFAPSDRLVTATRSEPRAQGGGGGFFAPLGWLFGGGGGTVAADIGPEVHIYKRLTCAQFSMSQTNAHGMSVPSLQGTQLAILIHMVKSKRSGKLNRIELDVVFPSNPLGWLVDPVTRTHGHVHFRTEPVPFDARAAPPPAATPRAGVEAAVGFSFFGGGAAAVQQVTPVEEWRAGIDRALNIAASFDTLDSYIRGCLERRLSEPARRALVRAREMAGLGTVSAQTVGDMLWASPELVQRKKLTPAELNALLVRHEICLSDETFKMLLGKFRWHLAATVEVKPFLDFYLPDHSPVASATTAART